MVRKVRFLVHCKYSLNIWGRARLTVEDSSGEEIWQLDYDWQGRMPLREAAVFCISTPFCVGATCGIDTQKQRVSGTKVVVYKLGVLN